MELISLLKLIIDTDPGVMGLVAFIVVAQVYTILRLEWKIRSMVEILTTHKLTARGKPYPLDLFFEMGVVSKRPLE